MSLDTVENLFQNLKIISRIQVGRKISTTQGSVRIDHSPMLGGAYEHFLQSIYRKIYGEGRTVNLDHIKNLYRDMFALMEVATERYKTDTRNEKDHQAYHAAFLHMNELRTQQFIRRGIKALIESLPGLNNMRKTYASDMNMTSDIDTLKDNVIDHMVRIEGALQNTDILTKDLRERILILMRERSDVIDLIAPRLQSLTGNASQSTQSTSTQDHNGGNGNSHKSKNK